MLDESVLGLNQRCEQSERRQPRIINAKEREKKEREARRAKKRKGIEALRVKHPTPSRATDALIGDEEQNRKDTGERNIRKGSE